MKLVTFFIYNDIFIFVILIHTSVKLVTRTGDKGFADHTILIHTSVKLVTSTVFPFRPGEVILIHTSVKLVTAPIP